MLVCLALAGPPPLEEEPPDVRAFADVVARVTADEELVELLAQAVQERDATAWKQLVEGASLQRFSHLLCHWVLTVRYRLVCGVVCSPVPVPRPELIPELRAAGQAIGRLAADAELFAAAAKAVEAGSCETLGSTLREGGFAGECGWICEFFCSWRCLLLCLRFCRVFPLPEITSEIEEMREFALAGAKLATGNGALQRLAAAFLREDVEGAQALVKELGFERFCIQFCHWVCFLRCIHFCICVCPPSTVAVFTKIGTLYYETDIHSTAPGTGLTVADSRAFYRTLRCNGGISVVDGAPLIEYRFETAATKRDGTFIGPWVKVDPSQIAATNIGSFVRPIAVPPFVEVIPVWVNNPAPGVFNITPDADGWILVPPFTPVPPMVPGPGFRFVPGSDLIQFDSTHIAPIVSIDETGVNAGDPANAPLQVDAHLSVRMRIRNHGDSGDGSNAGTCGHIAINNSQYEHVSHHPYWPGGLFGASHELAVASLGIAELASAPCSLLTDSLTVQFTAANSNLGAVSIVLEGPGGPYAFDLNPSSPEDVGENWYGTATPALVGSPPAPAWTFATLPPCAYLLSLFVTPLLTNGDPGSHPDPLHDYIAFCKGAG